MKILVINGPNLNMLGKRDPAHYGNKTLEDINRMLEEIAKKEDVSLAFYQSNVEGELVNYIQEQSKEAAGIVINPGALTHYGYSLADAVADSKLPTIVVHLSDVQNREDFRKIDVFKDISIDTVSGLKEKSYEVGLDKLIKHLKKI